MNWVIVLREVKSLLIKISFTSEHIINFCTAGMCLDIFLHVISTAYNTTNFCLSKLSTPVIAVELIDIEIDGFPITETTCICSHMYGIDAKNTCSVCRRYCGDIFLFDVPCFRVVGKIGPKTPRRNLCLVNQVNQALEVLGTDWKTWTEKREHNIVRMSFNRVEE